MLVQSRLDSHILRKGYGQSGRGFDKGEFASAIDAYLARWPLFLGGMTRAKGSAQSTTLPNRICDLGDEQRFVGVELAKAASHDR